MRNLYAIIIVVFCFIITDLRAQNQQFWASVSANQRASQGIRYITPDHYATFHFDTESFRKSISAGTLRNNVFYVPLPDGGYLSFLLQETPVFEAELMRKYPGFNSFTGVNENGDRLKMSLSPFGINVMIFSEKHGHVFIDPITLHDHNDIYQVYYKKDFKKKTGKFTCSILPATDDSAQDLIPMVKDISKGIRSAGDCQLRSYRLAISCTGEYAGFHGGTKEKVLAAYNTTMTRVNGVYEKDAGITMKLIADTDKVIFLNSSTDPFTNGNGDVMLGQNQTTIDNEIGRNNYDIGHVFSTGGGGIAQLRSPCGNNKAMGVTGQARPVGDPFDIDYVAHEMGHQFGANHTQNNSCQRSGQAAMEPGSASTIMGYAGICEPNVQNNSDAYFHAHSIMEISNFIVAGNGNSCATIIPVTNAKPSVSVAKNEYIIPRTTSFALTAIGEDSDGDDLTYCWEQTNNNVATMPPAATSTLGPAFRSVTPMSSPTRYFPDLLRKYGQWEVLPSVSRTLNFRCTVRDNHPMLGCTDEVNVTVNVSAQAGPFVVLFPNTASVSWLAGSLQTVTWDIAKTDLAPINCAKVNIYLSTDGGATYPVLLAENVPNDGIREIVVPGITTTRARVMVAAADNIFFDVSNSNFKIVSSFELKFDQASYDICDEESLTNNLEITKVQNSSEQILLEINNPSTFLNYTFSLNPVELLPSSVEVSVSGLQTLPKGWQNVEVKASRNAESLIASFAMYLGYTGTATVQLIQPERNKFDVAPNNVNFIWEQISGVKDYTFELSLSPSFANTIQAMTIATNNLNMILDPGKVYFWRVKPNSPCNQLPYSAISSFRTIGLSNGTANIVTNEALLVDKSSVSFIDTTRLMVFGENRNFIVFTITNETKEGVLYRNNEPLTLGSTFTLSDIVAGNIKYQHSGGSKDQDVFIFNVIDDLGRWLPDVTFIIKIKQGVLGIVAYRDNLLKCFGDIDGSISGQGYGGVAPYTYSLDGINFQEDAFFSGLEAGSYTLFIKDDIGDIANSNVVILEEPSPFSVLLNLDKYDINIDATGGTGTLSYSIDGINFQTEPIFKNVANGSQMIYVKDEVGCLIVSSLEVDIPLLNLTGAIITNVICANQSASITVNASGGFPPYSYSVDGTNFKTSPNFSVQPGRYVFQVKDAGEKISFSDTISTNFPVPIDVQLVQNKLEITVNATGGTGSLKYSTNNINFTDNNVITFSDNGSYKIYVRDSLLCSKVTNVSLNVLKNLNITARDISCNGKNDGFIRIVPTNGGQPFKYSLNGSAFSNVREWSGLSGGEYTYIVKDNKNDSLTGVINIKNPESLTLEFLIQNKDLEILVSGGTPPYVHSIDNGIIFLDTNQFTALEEQKYDVVVRDKNGCIVSGSILISGISDSPLSGIHIYPNPTGGDIFIVTDRENMLVHKIQITDLAGKIIDADQKENGNSTQIALGSHTAGLYVVKIVTNEGTFSKLIVKRD
jgi:hypothetical protein